MSLCPHCKKSTTFDRSPRWSSRGYPITCTECDGLSHVLESTRTGITALTFVMLLGSLLVALATGLWPLGITGAACAIAGNVWVWRRVELFPIPGKNALMARRVDQGTSIAAILSMFLFW